jgi:hypothetical protein
VKRSACITAGLMFGLGLFTSHVDGQSVIGPDMSRKSADASTVGLPDPPNAELDWLSWTETEAVTILVHEPIKLIGMERFGSNASQALKPLVTQAERRIRGALRAYTSDATAAGEARQAMQEALDQYRSGLAELLDAR